MVERRQGFFCTLFQNTGGLKCPFDDLCTPTELRSLEQRFDVAVYLQQGLVYLDILDKTGASSATISRVRRSMLDNGAGGVMQEVIQRHGLHERDEP